MAVEKHEYSSIAVATHLSAGITDSTTTLLIDDSTGWPSGALGSFRLVIDRGLSSEEIIKASARSGNSITVATRGDCNTAAISHGLGSMVEHVFTDIDATETNQHAAVTTRDDHTQYVHVATGRTISANHTFTGHPVVSGEVEVSGQLVVSGSGSIDLGSNYGGTPQPVSSTTAAVGTSKKVAHDDHAHKLDLTDLTNFLPIYRLIHSVGTVRATIGAVADPNFPNEWLWLNGSTFVAGTYPALYAYLGNSNTLPDYRDRSLVGIGSSTTLNQLLGAPSATLSAANMPHQDITISDPGHTHSPVHSGVDVFEMVITAPPPQTHFLPAFGNTTDIVHVTYSPLYNATTGVTANSIGNSSPTAIDLHQPSVGTKLWVKAH